MQTTVVVVPGLPEVAGYGLGILWLATPEGPAGVIRSHEMGAVPSGYPGGVLRTGSSSSLLNLSPLSVTHQ
jgi:hypothetical protein